MTGLSEGLHLSSRFELVNPLGRGGMGEVWLANDLELNEQIALKVLRSELSGDQLWLDLLREECRRVRNLVHPGIVRVYDFHHDGPYAFISMQYVPGASLVQSRGQAWQDILQTLLPVTDALEYAHRQGLVHRDIKASNVLLGEQQQPLLTDFGVAALAGSESDASRFLKAGGSLPGMSPQQLGGAEPAISDDIYGFGSMLYELLSGQPLFHPDVTEQKVMQESPPRLDSFDLTVKPPADLVGLVATMLQKNPLQRPQSIATVRAAIERLLTEEVADDVAKTMITPKRRKIAAGVEPVQQGNHPPPLQPEKDMAGEGLSRKVIVAGVALLVLLISVVLLLPGYVAEKAAEQPEVQSEQVVADVTQQVDTTSAEPQLSAEELRALREQADEVLGDVLALNDGLQLVAVKRWGGGDWNEARDLVDSADDFYKQRNYQAATAGYREALSKLEALEARVPFVLQQTLDAGLKALLAGDQQPAIDTFNLALEIDPQNAIAKDGLQRALLLDQVLAAMNRAIAAEADKDWSNAAAAYREVLALDAAWEPAQEGAARADRFALEQRYNSYMGAGFSALATKDYVQAKTSFDSALVERPGDADALAALRTLADEQQLASLRSSLAKAKIAEITEDWTLAVKNYEAVLRLDGSLAAAVEGKQRSALREQLDQQLQQALAAADSYNDTRALGRAEALLLRAQTVLMPGERLQLQMTELAELLRVAAIPLPVEFISDGETNVVIYKVGRFGQFARKTLQLRPGVYTVVGNRDGYRDVRIKFRVVAGQTMAPLVLECKEPI